MQSDLPGLIGQLSLVVSLDYPQFNLNTWAHTTHLEEEQLLLWAPEKRMFEHAGGGGAGLGLGTDHVLDQIQSDDVVWRQTKRKEERKNSIFRPIAVFGSATSRAGWRTALGADRTCRNVCTARL